MSAKIALFAFPLMACFLLSFIAHKKPARIVFFGDSITEAGVQPGGYITQMRDSLAARGASKRYTLLGAGIGGNKIYDLYLRLEEDVLRQKPKIVVMYVGVNDVWHKQTFGTGTDADKFQKFYIALIQRFQKKGIRVVICTPACIGERHQGENPLDAELDRFSDIIRAVSKQTGTALCDLRNAFMDYSAQNNPDNMDKGVLTTDGVHLNEKGNTLVAKLLLPLI